MFVRSPTLTNSESSSTVNGSSPDSRSAGATIGRDPRGAARPRRRRWRAMCAGVVPQQPPTRLTRPAGGELPDDGGGLLGRLVVLAEGVGQAGVGIGGDERVRDPGHLGDVGPHLGGAEGAVQPHRERAGVPDGVPERLGGLARQGAAGGVGDGAGDDQRPAAPGLLEQGLDREDRGLRVEGVEDGLDHQQVGAAVDQPPGGGRGRPRPARPRACCGRRRRSTSGEIDAVRVVGPERPDDVAGPRRAWPTSSATARASAGGRQVELVGEVLHAVVGEGDRGGVEGVRLDQVGAGREVLAVDVGDDRAAGSGSAGRCCRPRPVGQSANRSPR